MRSKLSLLITTCTMLILSINIYAQSLPEFVMPESPKIYAGIYNNIIVKLNEADPTKIKIKASDTHLKKLNDTLYQIMLRSLSEGDELKVKLYYKNLPIDIAKMVVSPAPTVNVSIDGFNKSIKLTPAEAMKAEVSTEMSDSFLNSSGYVIHTFSVKLVSKSNKMMPLFNAKNGNLSSLSRFNNRLKKGDTLLLTDFRMRNKSNTVISCQSNYFEILID